MQISRKSTKKPQTAKRDTVKRASMDELEELPTDSVKRRQIAKLVIDTMNRGKPFIQACRTLFIQPSAFLKFIEQPDNIDLLQAYYSARVLLAEWYLDRREELEQQLLLKKIDVGTYQALAGDYVKLAGKLAPLAYGDKIAFEQYNNNITIKADTAAVARLNELINGIKPIETQKPAVVEALPVSEEVKESTPDASVLSENSGNSKPL